LKNPQDILKAVHSMQEENVKNFKQIENWSKDKIKKFESGFSYWNQMKEITALILAKLGWLRWNKRQRMD
jgi:alanyl-tRNA synthetase